MSEFQTANVVLHPWNGHEANFQLIANGKMIVNEKLSSGEWNVYGEIQINWTGHTYKFNTASCEGQEGGERFDIGYIKKDPTKPDSIVVTCGTYEEGYRPTTTVPSTTSTTVEEQPTTTMVSVTTPVPNTNGNVPCTVNCGIAGPTSVVPQVLSVSTENLPVTGSETTALAGIGLMLIVLGYGLKRRFANG